MAGYVNHMICEPKAGVGVVVMMNGFGDPDEVAKFVLNTFVRNRQKEALPEVSVRKNFLSVPDAVDYAGAYTGPNGNLSIEADGERLFIGEARTPMAKRAADMFHVEHPNFDDFFLRFDRNEQGDVTGFTHGSSTYYLTGHAIPEEKSFPSAWKAYPGQYRSKDPWAPNSIRILLRTGNLFFQAYFGGEERLVEIEPGIFRIGEDRRSPEFLRFEMLVDDKAESAVYSGKPITGFGADTRLSLWQAQVNDTVLDSRTVPSRGPIRQPRSCDQSRHRSRPRDRSRTEARLD